MGLEVVAIPGLSPDEVRGQRVGRFELICKLSSGGMADVFLAWQRSVAGFQRPVVLKRIKENFRDSPDFLHMFVAEAKITAGFTHGSIAQMYDLVMEAEQLYMVMEYVPGATLVELARELLLHEEHIPIGLTLPAVCDTAEALHYAHHFVDPAGVPRPTVHRDVAGKNIMVDFDGQTKLLDFGIAKQQGQESRTAFGHVKGTGGYMSPEQLRGEALDGRSDVFSLGIVLHELLTGQRLYLRRSHSEILEAVLFGKVTPPSEKNARVPQAVDQVVLKALAQDRAERFASAREFGRALADAARQHFWLPDQRGALVARYFGARRAQLAERLLDSAATQMSPLAEVTSDPDQPAVVSGRVSSPHLGGALPVARLSRPNPHVAMMTGKRVTQPELPAVRLDDRRGPSPRETSDKEVSVAVQPVVAERGPPTDPESPRAKGLVPSSNANGFWGTAVWLLLGLAAGALMAALLLRR